MAWANWKKPFLKPGDFVVMLRPWSREDSVLQNDVSCPTLLTQVDKAARLCVVHRFWTEQDEKSRHAFWVPGGIYLEDLLSSSPIIDSPLHSVSSPIEEGTRNYLADVSAAHLDAVHPGKRGPEAFEPIISIGKLRNGEPYFIYRFLLFWDGFRLFTGKQASGDGVYMLCLNLPPTARSSSSAVRIISLTPPGVKLSAVLNRITPDLVRGMTEGILDIDAEGTKRRIFLDMIGVLGDTPALNSVLDVLGHTALACCHLCRFIKGSATITGSKFSAISMSGSHSASCRGLFQHTAVLDSGVTKDTARLLGIKTNVDQVDLVLHQLQAARFAARARIHSTEHGVPVVPFHLDPYRACFVAPDHLLTVHMRDCITLAFKLLPTAAHRKAVEETVIAYLTQVGHGGQKRLFDHDKKSLLTMNMTDIYAVGMVAELSFRRGCALLPEISQTELRPKCDDAIALIGSCANLILLFWKKPEKGRDSPSEIMHFEECNGQKYIFLLQTAVEGHLQKIQNICSMSDAESISLDDPDCPFTQKYILSGTYRDFQTAIKTIDRPNVHRLHELVCTTLPMVGHMCLIGELVLEKAHQVLKRALRQSNYKDVQLVSMESAAIDDWQGRLTAAIPGALKGEIADTLSCFRLLHGREAVLARNGEPSDSEKLQILKIIGSVPCIESELITQGKTVMSPRCVSKVCFTWTVQGQKELLNLRNAVSEPTRAHLIKYLRMAFRSSLDLYTVYTGTEISSTLDKSIQGYSFRFGDVVEILCCHPKSLRLHFPFVLQTNCSDYLGSLALHSGHVLWQIQALVSLVDESEHSTLYLGLRPCVVSTTSSANLQYEIRKYCVHGDEKISFARIDSSLRRVGVVREYAHAYSNSEHDSSLSAHPALANGSEFFAFSRDSGFPPRQG